MKYLLILTFALTSLNSFGQNKNLKQYFEIESISSEGQEPSYSIPLIKSDESPDVAEKINQVIQLTTVSNSYSVSGKNLFSKMKNEDGYGAVSLNYTILLNSESILSIRFDDETISAYPDYHSYYLNFNSANGDIIDIHELLNQSGMDRLNDIASSTINNRIKQYHLETLKDNSLEQEEQLQLFDYIFDLTECNATHEILKYGFTNESVIVEKDRCFPHAMQAYDISWGTSVKTDELFKSGFTLYGTNVLKNNQRYNYTNFKMKESLMTLYGKIDNRYPFTMYLSIYDDNSIGGNYWYDKFGEPIDFKGKRLSSNRIEITEDNGKFLLDINDSGEISGTWENDQGEKMPIFFY